MALGSRSQVADPSPYALLAATIREARWGGAQSVFRCFPKSLGIDLAAEDPVYEVLDLPKTEWEHKTSSGSEGSLVSQNICWNDVFCPSVAHFRTSVTYFNQENITEFIKMCSKSSRYILDNRSKVRNY
jgi:hypothetical protein